ncbi:unnamed protein product [Parnassius apollo]|uniref:(apollo) hypothetical protein n=1 Tax=Parnassius apollo TaxID=110799 RepID=A0A8S3WNF1_PARAO|nr:unnamed protein product [Parnassius apollo]
MEECETEQEFSAGELSVDESFIENESPPPHETKFTAFLKDFDDIKTTLKFISDKYDDLDKKINDVSKRVTKTEQQLKSIQASEARISELETKLAEFEQKSRYCNIEISNLPEKRSENLIQIPENIAKVIKQSIPAKDIVTIHRVPHYEI